jgi:hypothetical protein
MSIKDGEVMQAKGIQNIFNKIIAETPQISRKRCLKDTKQIRPK